MTPGAVCERAGLGRSSFYAYFPTKDDLLVAIAIDAMARWDADIEKALEGVAVVMVTHDRDVLEHCDRVLEMIDGRLTEVALVA